MLAMDFVDGRERGMQTGHYTVNDPAFMAAIRAEPACVPRETHEPIQALPGPWRRALRWRSPRPAWADCSAFRPPLPRAAGPVPNAGHLGKPVGTPPSPPRTIRPEPRRRPGRWPWPDPATDARDSRFARTRDPNHPGGVPRWCIPAPCHDRAAAPVARANGWNRPSRSDNAPAPPPVPAPAWTFPAANTASWRQGSHVGGSRSEPPPCRDRVPRARIGHLWRHRATEHCAGAGGADRCATRQARLVPRGTRTSRENGGALRRGRIPAPDCRVQNSRQGRIQTGEQAKAIPDRPAEPPKRPVALPDRLCGCDGGCSPRHGLHILPFHADTVPSALRLERNVRVKEGGRLPARWSCRTRSDLSAN